MTDIFDINASLGGTKLNYKYDNKIVLSFYYVNI